MSPVLLRRPGGTGCDTVLGKTRVSSVAGNGATTGGGVAIVVPGLRSAAAKAAPSG